RDVRGELEQPLAEGPDLDATERGSRDPRSNLLQQDECGQSKEDPELVRPEPRAAHPVDPNVLQLPDAVLHFSSPAVLDLVELLGIVREVGDHVARVLFRLATREMDDL